MKKKFIIPIIIALLLTGCANDKNEHQKIKVPYSAMIKDNNSSLTTKSSVEYEFTEESSANSTEANDSETGSINDNSHGNIYNSSVNLTPQSTTIPSNITSGDNTPSISQNNNSEFGNASEGSNDIVIVPAPDIETSHSENENEITNPEEETSDSDYYKPEKPKVNAYLDYKFEYEILENGTLRLTECRERYRADGIEPKAGLIIPSEIEGKTVTEIGESLLSGCTFFCYLEIPDSVKKIGENAFWGCSGLEYVKLSNNLIDIGDSAFIHCSALKSIEIPYGITRINDFCFLGCESLISVSLPESLTYIGDSAFDHCPIYYINIPNSVTYIGSGAFIQPEYLLWEDEIGYLGNWVVGANRRFDAGDVSIKDGIKNIASSAFYNSPYTSITIPKSVTYIGDYAFYGCGWLKDIYYQGTKTDWENINIDQEGNELLSSVKIHFNS